jgi:hypothetical protein
MILGQSLSAGNGNGAMDFNLETYRWKNRILILFTPSTGFPDFLRQHQELRNHADEVRDRDLIVIELFGEQKGVKGSSVLSEQSVRALRSRYQVGPEEYRVILIGKDGTVKLASKTLVPAEQLFALIDSMPMRQQEMRRKKRPPS